MPETKRPPTIDECRKSLTYGSICSGIEAATVAWKPLGWHAAWFAEIDPFPCAVLAHHYPGVPNLGDISADDFAERTAVLGSLDVLIGGTPCQSFSVAGKRESLADDRGNLALVFYRLVERLDPWCVLWENVPGVLSTRDNAFGCFLAGLVGASAPLVPGDPAGRWPDAGLVCGPRRSAAWGILDAQHFGLAQRRRRVFVASLRADDWRCPAAILFEPRSLPWNPAPGGEEESGVAPSVTPGARRASGNRGGEQLTVGFQANGSCSKRAGAMTTAVSDDNGSNHVVLSPPLTTKLWSDRDCQHDRLVVDTLKAHHGRYREDDTYIPEIAHSLRAEGFDASEDGTGRGTPLVSCDAPIPTDMRQASRGETFTNNRAEGSSGGAPGTGIGEAGDPAPSLSLSHPPAIAYQQHGSDVGKMGTLRRGRGDVQSGVPFIVNAAESTATRDHARESDVARCLDSTGGFASSQGGTLIGDRTDRVKVAVCDTVTGDTAFDDRWDALWWMQGNGSCDCNRALLFGHPNVRDGYCDGCVRYRIVWVKPMPDGCTIADFNSGYPDPSGAATPFNIIGLGQQGSNHAYEADVSGCLQGKGLNPTGNEAGTVIAFQERGRDGGPNLEHQADRAYSLNAPSGGGRRQEMNVAAGMAVRRLMPVECERLQGFPDGYTDVSFKGKPAADGPRYKAIGNSMAVTVIRWLGRRIEWLRGQEEPR